MSDFLEIVEAAYAETHELKGWLTGLAATLEPHLNQGWGVCVARLSENEGLAAGSEGLAYATAGLPSDADDPYLQGHGLQSPEQTAQVLRRARQAGPVVSMFAMVGAPTDKRDPLQRAVKHALEGGMRQVVLPRGARDVVMVLGDTMDGEYLGATALRREPWQSSRANRNLWRRISTHLGAGLRLRRQTAPAAAIVTPGGRIEHAEPCAEQRDSLAAIGNAVRSTEKARGRMRRDDPEQALELWRALVSGRWSLVDHFDSDGRRYILARENAPDPPGPEQLTPRQRAAVTLRARGHSLKHIGYELGLSVPTISIELRAALRVLGVRSVVELGALFAPTRHGGGTVPP